MASHMKGSRAGKRARRTARRWSVGGIFRLAGVTAIGLVLAYAVGANTLVAYLQKDAPDLAVRIAPNASGAILSQIDGLLNPRPAASPEPGVAVKAGEAGNMPGAAPSPDLVGIKRAAITALSQDPLSTRALRILGQVADMSKDTDTALRFHRLAARGASRELVALHRLLVDDLERQQWSSAIGRLDHLLRAEPKFAELFGPLLAMLSQTPVTRDLLVARLAVVPNWRRSYYRDTLPHITDFRAPFDVSLALAKAGAPPQPWEVHSYLQLLLAKDQQELAYSVWLSFMPEERLGHVRLIYDGKLELPRTQQAFDWTIIPTSNFKVDIEAAGQGSERAFKVELGSSRILPAQVGQRLVLAPGRYRFSVKARGELSGRKGLKWTIACEANARNPLGQTPVFLGIAASWQVMDASFEIPQSQCVSQLLRLEHDARFSAEQFATGVVWYFDPAIERIDLR